MSLDLKIPLPKAKMLVTVHSLSWPENTDKLQMEFDYDPKLAAASGLTLKEIEEELGSIILSAIEREVAEEIDRKTFAVEEE